MQPDKSEEEKGEATQPSTPERPVNQNTQRRAHRQQEYKAPRKKLYETPEEILTVFHPALLNLFRKS